MRIRKAVLRDIGMVWPNLAERTKSEYELAKYSTQEVRKIFKDWIKVGRAHTILDGENRIAIIAWDMEDGEMVTSFAGTDAFFEARFVRPSIRYITDLQKNNGNCAMVSYSYSKHPRVAKWFAVLGFSLHSSSDSLPKKFVRNPQ